MAIIETLNSLSWPAVFAIVGSLTTIVVGLLGYLISSQKLKVQSPSADKLQLIHSRISEIKDRTAEIEGDVKLLFDKSDTLAKKIDDHETRDIADFKNLEQKFDKLTDVIMKILQDEKL